MHSNTTKLLATAAVVGLVLTAVPSTVVANGLAVETGNASNVTATTAKLHGNLTDMGGENTVNVSFEYWEAGDPDDSENTSTISLSEPGEFAIDADGLSPNTTYTYVARAEANGTTAKGEKRTFTTDSYDASPTPFGLKLVSFIRSLGGEEIIGPAVANYTTANNPGNAPAEAGPPAWLMNAIVGQDNPGPHSDDRGQDKPAHAGNSSDNGQGPPEEASNASNSGNNGPPEDAGNASDSGNNGPPEDAGNPADPEAEENKDD